MRGISSKEIIYNGDPTNPLNIVGTKHSLSDVYKTFTSSYYLKSKGDLILDVFKGKTLSNINPETKLSIEIGTLLNSFSTQSPTVFKRGMNSFMGDYVKIERSSILKGENFNALTVTLND